MPATTNTRQRIVDTSAELLRRQGYVATGVKQIVTEAQAPFGSLYHHFPGGKEQLGAEAIRVSGALYEQLIPAVFDPAPGPAERGARVLRRRRRAPAPDRLCRRVSDRDRLTRGVEHQRDDARGVRGGVRELDRGVRGPARRAAGWTRRKSRELAIAMFAALEGAFVLARAVRSTEALAVAGELTASAVEQALAQAAS